MYYSWSFYLIFLFSSTFAFSPVFYEYHLQCNENNPTTTHCTFSDVNGDQFTKWHYEPAPDTRWTYKVRPDSIVEVTFTQCTIPEIPKGLFSYYKNVRTVTAQRAQLFGLYSYTFVGAIKLYKLDLSFNNVTVIADKVFGDCTALAYMNLADNHIEKLGEYAFYALRQLKSLDLQNNQIHAIHPAVFQPLINLEILILAENAIDTLNEGWFVKNSKLSHIDLSHNKLKEINGKCFEHLKNLTVLNVAHNQLREFSTEFFIVRKLYLTGNWIEYIYIVHDIDVLDASDNKIKGMKLKPGMSVGSLKIRNNSLSDVTQFCSISTLTTIDLSFNPIIIGDSTFASLTNVDTIDLQHCKLKKLPRNVFANMKNLKNLNLAHNEMEYFDTNWVLNTHKLMNLYLDGNRLTDFNFNAIKHKFDNFSEIGLSNNAFDCNYLKDLVAQIRKHKVKVFFEEPVTNTPNVEFIGCNEKPAHLIACDEKFGQKCTFNNVHGDLREYWRYETFVDVTVIEQIIFTKSVIKEIPRGLLQYFKNARYLTVVECYVEEIYEYTFYGGQQLAQIDLSHNKIKELKPGVFTECIYITEIIIEYNIIHVIHPGAFEGLKNLQSMSLEGNKLTQLDGQVFLPLSTMKTIDLSGNEIYIIDELVFAHNPKLEEVDLSQNDIKQLPKNIFNHQKNVSVNLEGNELKTYEPIPNVKDISLGGNHLEAVQIPPNTQHFKCENNHLKSIQVLEYTEYLVFELILRNNSLEDVSGLSKLTNLESIDLSQNKPHLQANTFQNNRKVKVLRLVECEITIIYETLFINLPQLQVLDLSKNKLETFDVKNVKNNAKLQTLNLEFCGLTKIENLELLQNHVPQLKEVYLANNKFSCDYLRHLIEYFKKRAIKVVVPNPAPNGPNVYEGIACSAVPTTDSTNTNHNDVEIMQPGMVEGPDGKLQQPNDHKKPGYHVSGGGGDIEPEPLHEGEPICCVEIIELRQKVKQLEREIHACKQGTIEYVNQALAMKKIEIEQEVREMVTQLLNQRSNQAAGNTYMHSRFQNEEFTG